MSASLVGSEMCIRDSMSNDQVASFVGFMKDAFAYLSSVTIRHCAQGFAAVSYTHLTLPTICSV
eukprot:11957175-Alexandrium_andersonii.AAC.1